MRFRNRELNIFNMSALDLFASALGAFILISIVLMPYYLRTDPQEVEELRRNLAAAEAAATQARAQTAQAQAQTAAARAQAEQARAAVQQCQQQVTACRQQNASLRRGAASLQRCQAELKACKVKLTKTFLAIVIQWRTERHDIDLHVIDPAGREFYFDRARIPGRPGELSADTIRGPGVEIWEVAEAPVGTYRVLYNFYKRNGNFSPPLVKGGVYHRDGHYKLRQRRLTRTGRGNARLVAEVTVKPGGDVEIVER